jgi:hypothetical protein
MAGVKDVARLVVKPAVTGTMQAQRTKSKRRNVNKKQWVAYVGAAVLTACLTRAMNHQIEHRLGDR